MNWSTVKWFRVDVRPVPRPLHRGRPEYRARGRVWKRGDTWHYEVRVGDRVVLADNTNNWRLILDDCNLDVLVADRIVRSGHGFRMSWDELVDGAR